jgi:tRNA-dihydrouridine synthase 3
MSTTADVTSSPVAIAAAAADDDDEDTAIASELVLVEKSKVQSDHLNNVNDDATTVTKTTTSQIQFQNDSYSLKVKPEYILQERHPSLSPDTLTDSNNEDKHQQQRGMNKKRPRDVQIPDSAKACLAILRGEECKFGAETCRFSHDIKELLNSRPEDIQEVEGGCPRYNHYGYCEFGLMCRLGASHCNMATGENLRQVIPQELLERSMVTNSLSKELQTTLRKKKFPFQNQQQRRAQDTRSDDAAHPKEDYTTPLPSKERKLVDFSNKVYVAPLTTVGNLPFRRIMKQYGADITCGEMAVATQLLEGKAQEWALLKRHASEDVFGIQLAGGYPDQFTKVAQLLNQHVTVDFVDLNMGCPLDMLCNKGAGAGLMMREKRLKESVIGIVNTLNVPITIKMRTGWDEGKPFARELVTKIGEWDVGGISAIMIHGRSRLQRYQKLANWDYIEQVAKSGKTDIPIIGNGDIFSFTDYEEKLAKCPSVLPCAMLARGALIKPWLPAEIKERRHWDISATERLDMLKEFVKFGLEHWGSDNMGINKTRRFLLEWISFLYRYVPVGLLEVLPQQMNHRAPVHLYGRSDLETLMMSKNATDWIKLSEMLLGKVPDGFQFEPKHKANG